MDEITIGEKTYISSKQAAKITGYAKDYVGQLCREGRVEARLVGRNWYVLDSAIREHRFGKGETVQEEKAPTPEPDRVSTWEKPQYEAETPILVPSFSRKADSGDIGTPAIADMQSAWREWFQDKQPDQVMSEPVSEEDEISDNSAPAAIYAMEEVTVSRIQYKEEEQVVDEPQEELQAEEAVDLHRIYTPKPVEAPAPVARDVTNVAARAKREVAKVPAKDKGIIGTAVTRALLIVVAVAVALIALIGTGRADSYLAGTSLDFGVQKEIIDYLGGKSTYESSFK